MGVKTNTALHSECRLWVISGQTITGENPNLSAMHPIATIALVGILPPDQAAPLWRDVQAQATAIFRRPFAKTAV
jgi:hypothetical protein